MRTWIYSHCFTITAAMRFRVLVDGASVSFIAFIGFGLISSFPGMVLMLFIGGILSSVSSVFMPASIHLIVPPEMRGKVFSLAGMLTQGLMPVGMGLGGILGEYSPLRTIIVAAYAVQLLVFLFIAFIPSFKRCINFDPNSQTMEDLS